MNTNTKKPKKLKASKQLKNRLFVRSWMCVFGCGYRWRKAKSRFKRDIFSRAPTRKKRMKRKKYRNNFLLVKSLWCACSWPKKAKKRKTFARSLSENSSAAEETSWQRDEWQAVLVQFVKSFPWLVVFHLHFFPFPFLFFWRLALTWPGVAYLEELVWPEKHSLKKKRKKKNENKRLSPGAHWCPTPSPVCCDFRFLWCQVSFFLGPLTRRPAVFLWPRHSACLPFGHT